MFVNMRQPHVILAMRKESPAAWPISNRGSVRGGVLVLRYGKSLGEYTVITRALRLIMATVTSKPESDGLIVQRGPGLSATGREVSDTPSPREEDRLGINT